MASGPLGLWASRASTRRVHTNEDASGADCTLVDRGTTPHRAVVGVGKTLGEAIDQALSRWLDPEAYLVELDSLRNGFEIPTDRGMLTICNRDEARGKLILIERLTDGGALPRV